MYILLNLQNRFKSLESCLNYENWKSSTCTCPSWFKRYMCKHIVGIAYKEQLFDDFPDQALDVPLGKTRPVGIPKNLKCFNAQLIYCEFFF